MRTIISNLENNIEMENIGNSSGHYQLVPCNLKTPKGVSKDR